jgi:hypothetical protein
VLPVWVLARALFMARLPVKVVCQSASMTLNGALWSVVSRREHWEPGGAGSATS